MAKAITVNFTDGGVFEGFASTYILNEEQTIYFSFDRDYRIQIDASNAITLQEYRNAGAWYPIELIDSVALTDIGGDTPGTEYATKKWVQENYQPKGDYLTGTEGNKRYQPKGDYIDKQYGDNTYMLVSKIDEYFKNYVTFAAMQEQLKLYVKRTGDIMTGPLKFPEIWHEVIGNPAIGVPETTLDANGDFNVILSNTTNGLTICKNEENLTINYLTLNLMGIHNDFFSAGMLTTGFDAEYGIKLYEGMTGGNFNVLFGSNRINVESPALIYLNNSFTLDGELTFNEYESRLDAGDLSTGGIILHPKDSAKDDKIGYAFIKYINNPDEMLYYLLAGDTAYGYGRIESGNFTMDVGTFVMNSSDNIVFNAKQYYSFYSSRSTWWDSDAGYLHDNLNAIKGLVRNHVQLQNLVDQESKLLALAGNETTLNILGSSMHVDTSGAYTLTASDSGLKYIQNITANNMTLNGHTYAEELEVKINPAAETERDQLEIMCNLFKLCGQGLEALGFEGASEIVNFSTDTALWYFDNDGKYLLPTTAHIDKLNVTWNK